MSTAYTRVGRARIFSPEFLDRLGGQPLHRDDLLTDGQGNWWIPRDMENDYR